MAGRCGINNPNMVYPFTLCLLLIMVLYLRLGYILFAVCHLPSPHHNVLDKRQEESPTFESTAESLKATKEACPISIASSYNGRAVVLVLLLRFLFATYSVLTRYDDIVILPACNEHGSTIGCNLS